ncbi:hypothetical protein B0I37DRAFT_152234 [Chaetomium sp. MPI-CAGE-AT-0009]|nr:hypothetical protein B0I37DRAFT_152234 [Chaetomium sp. MPI-CAGE-AT-0009]
MGSSPRDRAMPLVSEPFKDLSISRPSVFFGIYPTARRWPKFCPGFGIHDYGGPLSEEKKTELDKRANKLSRGTIDNQRYKSSKFGWELCAWDDVFGLIMDDQGIRMDEKPDERVGTDDSGESTVKTRIPDATLGLKSYGDFELNHEYTCTIPNCEDDHNNIKNPDKRLSKDRLTATMHNPECGLTVDSSRGNTDLVFPFAVYETKSYEAAEDRIYPACKTYFAMLDDLARNRDNVAEYQTTHSSKSELFAFTSRGPYWEVYLAWKRYGRCYMERAWEGDVQDVSRAFELLCIVDQLHDYVDDDCEFVMRHLEAWHARREKSLEPGRSFPNTQVHAAVHENGSSEMESGASDGENSDSSAKSISIEGIVGLMKSDVEIPECMWLRLKQKSKARRIGT